MEPLKQSCNRELPDRLASETGEVPPEIQEVGLDQKAASPADTRLMMKHDTVAGGIGQFPMTKALRELSDSGIRGSGMVILLSVVHSLECQLEDAKRELTTLRQDYQSECIKSTQLSTERVSNRKLKILQSFLLTAGGLLNTLGVKMLSDKETLSGIVLISAGVLLLVAGWLWPVGDAKK